MTAFKTTVRIKRPIEEVFAYVSDPLNFPHWNSAVRAVSKTHGRESEVGSKYTMQRELPSGVVQNELDGPAALLGPLAGRAVKRGVDDNLARLKRILETPFA